MKIGKTSVSALALIVAGTIAAGGGCTGSSPDASVAQTTTHGVAVSDMHEASCERSNPGVGLVREGVSRQGSTVALARDGGELVALVADKDSQRINVVDLELQKVDAAVAVDGQPEQVMMLADGRVVVTIADASHIEVFEPTGDRDTPLVKRCSREVPAGPFGLAASPDEDTVVVTSAWEAALTAFDGKTFALRGAAGLPRAPRGVLVDQRGKAFVSHVVGARVSVVELASLEARPRIIDTRVRAGSMDAEHLDLSLLRSGTQGYALASVEVTRAASRHGGVAHGEKPALTGAPPTRKPAATPKPRPNQPPLPIISESPDAPPVPAAPLPKEVLSQRIIIPMVSVDPGDPARPTRLYYGPPPTAGVAKHAPVAILVDPVTEKSLSTHVLATTNGLRSGECLMPRSMAYRASTQRLYVTCLGVDTMLELDARAVDPMRAVLRRFQLPKGPTGVAVADKEGLAVVWGQFDEALAVIPLGEGAVTRTIDTYQGNQALDARSALGRELFYRSEDARITFDGLACSSCHPDGGEDGVTWSTPEGMRQTPMLAGRLHGTAPYGWTRKQGTLEEYIADTSRRLGGSGLDGDSLHALAKFAKNLPVPPRRVRDDELIDQGRDVSSPRVVAPATSAARARTRGRTRSSTP